MPSKLGFNNYCASSNGLLVNSQGPHGLILTHACPRGHEGERNTSFSKIQLVDQKYRDKTTLTSES